MGQPPSNIRCCRCKYWHATRYSMGVRHRWPGTQVECKHQCEECAPSWLIPTPDEVEVAEMRHRQGLPYHNYRFHPPPDSPPVNVTRHSLGLPIEDVQTTQRILAAEQMRRSPPPNRTQIRPPPPLNHRNIAVGSTDPRAPLHNYPYSAIPPGGRSEDTVMYKGYKKQLEAERVEAAMTLSNMPFYQAEYERRARMDAGYDVRSVEPRSGPGFGYGGDGHAGNARRRW